MTWSIIVGTILPMSKTYCEKTRALLRKDSRQLRAIATGADVNFHWLSKFKNGEFPNPGVNTVEKLHEYLIGSTPNKIDL